MDVMCIYFMLVSKATVPADCMYIYTGYTTHYDCSLDQGEGPICFDWRSQFG